MDIDQFWALIESARVSAGDHADCEAIVAQAISLLSALTAEEIIAADQRLSEVMARSYLHPLWAAAYVINGGCSNDSFDYFRGWLMLQGRSVFETALAEPDGLADVPAVRAAAAADWTDLRHEQALSIAAEAYEIATGQDLPDDLPLADRPALDPGWNFDFDDRQEMQRRLPRLTALCWPGQQTTRHRRRFEP